MRNAKRVVMRICLLFAIMLVSVPAFAQAELFVGPWAPNFGWEDQPERLAGPNLVDYLGIPINDYARKWALAWSPGRLSLPEHQCQVHTVAYIHRGPMQMWLTEVRDPGSNKLIGINEYISTYEQERTIWMDGRPHPGPYAAHTWQGFSTGVFDGNMLTVTTTHIKQGWHRRNGIPSSDEITVVEHFVRRGNTLTHISVTDDPIYLEEPLIKSEDFTPGNQNASRFWPCEYIEETERPRGTVPSFMPGENPWLTDYAAQTNLPQEATLGGPATMYPEFRKKMKDMPKATKAD
jgi:hypothetical protein